MTYHATSDWRHQAACTDQDPELFFPIGVGDLSKVQTEQAKAVCRRCPVAQDCLAEALAARVTDGVWGGLDADQRRALVGARERVA